MNERPTASAMADRTQEHIRSSDYDRNMTMAYLLLTLSAAAGCCLGTIVTLVIVAIASRPH